jgi:hypothetical protein
MLAADIAKILLARVDYYLAKSSLVKMRASPVRTHAKPRLIIALNALNYPFGISGVELAIFFHSAFINIDLPPDAAAVRALVSHAGKLAVVPWSVNFHIFHQFSGLTPIRVTFLVNQG